MDFENHLKKLRKKYLMKLNLKVKSMKVLFQQKDWNSLRAELHKIKGTGLTYGFPEISHICRFLEQWVIKGEKHFFEMGFPLLEKALFERHKNKIYPLQKDKLFLKLQATIPEEENKTLKKCV